MRNRTLIWLLVILTGLYLTALVVDLSPWLRGNDEWRWTLRVLHNPLWRIIFPLLFLAVYTFVCILWLRTFGSTERPARKAEIGFLIFLSIAAPLIQLALAAGIFHLPLYEAFADTVSITSSNFHNVAVTTPDFLSQLPHFDAFMATLEGHAQTHPPGIILIHWLSWQFLETVPGLASALAMPLRQLQCHNVALMTLDNAQIAAAVPGMLTATIGGLTVWPLYALGRRLISPRSAAIAAMLFPVMPMFANWVSHWDQVYPLLFITALYLAHVGLESRSMKRLFLAGLALSIATFLSVGNAIPAAIVVLYGLMRMRRYPDQRRLSSIVSFVLGCLAIWLGYMLLYQVDLSELVAIGLRLVSEATRCPSCASSSARSYGLWVVWNPIDFASFFSIPLTLLLLLRLPAIIRSIRSYLHGQLANDTGWAALAVVVLLSFVVLDVAGIVRAEVSRLWSYFGPVLLLILLWQPDDSSASFKQARSVPAILIALVSLNLLVIHTRWQAGGNELDEPPARPINYVAPHPQIDNQAFWGHQIELLGYDLFTDQSSLNLNLYWQAEVQPPHGYTVFVHVLDANGQLIAQQDNMPDHDQLPTSCWVPNEYVADSYSLSIPKNARAPLSIELGMYRLDTGERLSLDDGTGTVVKLKVP
jgi:hypothetical protein